MTTIAVAIPHTPWVPERVESMKRISAELECGTTTGRHEEFGWYEEFTKREPNRAWSSRMWHWAVETGAEFVVFLNDDVRLSPGFVDHLQQMLETLPQLAVLGLAAQHPDGPKLHADGHEWYRTQSWVVGWGYGMWREDLKEFLAWRDGLPMSRIESTTEDRLINEWVSEKGRFTWHPLPTIVDHDLTLATQYAGNEEHEYRRSSLVLADGQRPRWEQTREPPLLPLPPPRRPDYGPLREVETVQGTISLAISHTPWVPARVESMDRLRGQLGEYPPLRAHVDEPPTGYYEEFTEKAPNDVWSERMWRWAAETSAEWCLFLQDDVIVAPHFWTILRAMLGVTGDRVIGLEVATHAAPALYRDGFRWAMTSDGLIGVGYVMRRDALIEFLKWRRECLKPGWIGKLNEDDLIGLWCLASGNRVWHPIPTIIDHDTTIASSYGNDHHSNRRPLVRWDTVPAGMAAAMCAPTFWLGPARHLGCFYLDSPTKAERWVDGFGPERRRLAQEDNVRNSPVRVCSMCLAEPAILGNENACVGLRCIRGIRHHSDSQFGWIGPGTTPLIPRGEEGKV
jgi:hypothetical protein